MPRADVRPSRGAFAPGEPARLLVEIEADSIARAIVRLSIFHLSDRLEVLTRSISLVPGKQTIEVDWPAPPDAPRGYGVELEVIDSDQSVLATASTAFDVLGHWTQAPRYGFLTDFSPGRDNIDATLDALAQFHVNALQFYDWMYRHDSLLPPGDEYHDPLDRPLSLATIRSLIDAAHKRGMAAMPYTAIYAASPDFYAAHLGWALFRADGQPMDFAGGFLIYMNPAEGAPWREHLLSQFESMLRALDFDGIHIDQYGDPVAARDAAGRIVMLDRTFSSFVDAAAARAQSIRPRAVAVFNCVANWPIELVAHSQTAFMYVEVWKPDTSWRDLWRIVVEAQRLSGKPVVLAAYIDPAREHNVRLADAIIFASGGFHIELGEPGALLADPYFPKYGRMSATLAKTLRAYYDFAVRYENILSIGAHDATDDWRDRVQIESTSQARGDVWSIVREGDGFTAISLINLTGLASSDWTTALPAGPARLESPRVHLYTQRRPARTWFASPDDESLSLAPIASLVRAGSATIDLPQLICWTLIWIEWEP